MSFAVYVDDNFNYQDESERYKKGEFASYDEALAVAQAIVDQFLQDNSAKYENAEELLSSYKSYGYDPYIVPGLENGRFSAWDYAETQCNKLYSTD